MSSEAISTRFFSLVWSSRPSLAEVVVLPEPCRPTIRMGAGGEPMESASFSAPRVSTSTSWTILITCWPGVTERITFSPTARGRTLSMNSFTTGSATSASIRAVRTSARAASTSASVRAPRAPELVEDAGQAGLQAFKHLHLVLTLSLTTVRIVIFQALTPQGAHLRCLGAIPRAGRGTGKALGLSGKRSGFRLPMPEKSNFGCV